MSSSPDPDRACRAGNILFVGTAGALERAGALIAAHAARRPVRTCTARPEEEAWRRELRDAGAVILVADPATWVGDAIEGVCVETDGRHVVAGVMPDDPRAFAAAAALQRRAGAGLGPVALLSGHEDHVRARVGPLAEALRGGSSEVYDLPSARVDRTAMLSALGAGPGLAIYTGEGTPRGWTGYRHVQSWELAQASSAPMGALVSLSCSGSAGIGSIRALAETVVESGAAASALGAVGAVARADDEALGMLLARRFADGATCLADLVVPVVAQLALFRISGDPLAPFVGAPGSDDALRGVEAPAVAAELAPVDWS
ncbi:hypothetical protein [Microbacterium candidum]|uniref:Uncharacterized protein n=1 Tax=Microbacterium candidum TaxID=3041922 RepID=A0ABT7N017_9MICO|nr:hypothetical protein [Microbacterium sp. ASV49]MDL9980027.1 hypothetical protein [Microbacterium sp. ASV49]